MITTVVLSSRITRFTVNAIGRKRKEDKKGKKKIKMKPEVQVELNRRRYTAVTHLKDYTGILAELKNYCSANGLSAQSELVSTLLSHIGTAYVTLTDYTKFGCNNNAIFYENES